MSFATFDFDKRQNELIEDVVCFVYSQLGKWRDMLKLSYNESEVNLNANLTKYLDLNARENEKGYLFSHEEPQGKRHIIDIAACPYNKEHYDEPIIVFECKRLTAMVAKERKDEYVTGHKEITGGIQRFKLEVHGKEHEIVGMIGYVQSSTCSEWQETVNNCIDDLCSGSDEHGLSWTKDEHLNTVERDEMEGKLYSKSIHPRITKLDITIHHLWVNMHLYNSQVPQAKPGA